FEKTGAWSTWKTQEVSLMLTAGENSVKFATLDGSDGPNIDQFDVTLVKEIAPASSSSVTETSSSGTTSIRWSAVERRAHMAASVAWNVFDVNGVMVAKGFGSEVDLAGMRPGSYVVKAAGRLHKVTVK
nr:hypothetical protein [Fibrobacter sp.]